MRLLVDAAADYQLSSDARVIVDRMVEMISSNRREVRDRAELTRTQRDAFMGTQFAPDSLG